MSKMELLSFLVIFMSREPFRLTALRHASDPVAGDAGAGGGAAAAARATQSLRNLSWGALPLGALLSLAAWTYFATSGWGTEGAGVPGAAACISLYVAACLVELASEPAFIAAQRRLEYGVRARVESAANVIKCLATYACVVGLDQGVVGFGLAQLAFACVLAGGYWAHAAAVAGADGLPLPGWLPPAAPTPTRALVDAPERRMLAAFGMQSAIKFLMSESDRLVMAYSAGLYEQGVYAVVTNYGVCVVDWVCGCVAA